MILASFLDWLADRADRSTFWAWVGLVVLKLVE